MAVQITDCTIRDGGYLLNKNSDPKFIKGIIKGLVDAGIDFIETGFLQDNITGETLVYKNSKDVIKYLPEDNKNSEYLGFCDNSRYSNDNLDSFDGNSFKWLRISFAKHEMDSALKFCSNAKSKGYFIQCNPMDAISYSKDEWITLINKVNIVKPASFSIVDTFGAMYIDDLIEIYTQSDKLLDKNIKIGLHSHDNLGLSTALAEILVLLSKKTNRDIIIDGSLFSMGRGAGNASTELLADYLNKCNNGKYNIPILLDTIEKYILPITKDIKWGYDIPMYICGTMHAHTDNVYHLQKEHNSDNKTIFNVVKELEPSKRTRYGKNYSKADFTDIEIVYNNIVGGN